MLLSKKSHIFSLSKIVFSCLLALYTSVYIELFYEAMKNNQDALLSSNITVNAAVHILLLFVVIAICVFLFVSKGGRLCSFLYKYRFLIAGIVFVLGIVFEISGSSIGIWASLLGVDDSGILFGTSRSIRSDEWLVFTPFAFSQEYTDYSDISSIIRGDETITTIVYGQPSWAIATFFRPFLWGYLFLGSAKGLSFFWLGRLIVLFLVSLEFGRLITSDNKYLSATYAIFITCAPIVQWWFAVNGTAELLIFGQLLVLFLYRFLRVNTAHKKFLIAFLIAWFSGCFLMVIYPSWQVCLFYVFAFFGVWVVKDYFNEKKKNSLIKSLPLYVSVVALTIAIVVLVILLSIVFISGWDAVSATMKTVYPGSRMETGGEGLELLFTYGFNLFTVIDSTMVHSLTSSGDVMNVCEFSSFFCLFPLGTIMGLICSIKFKDLMSALLIAIQGFFLVYCCVGFPEWLSQITLLKNVQSIRLVMAIGFLEICLLFRSITLFSVNKKVLQKKKKIFGKKNILIVIGLLIGYLGCLINTLAEHRILFVFIFTISWLIILFVALTWHISEDEKLSARKFLIATVCVVGLAGLFVNPIRHGISVLTESPQYKAIQDVTFEQVDSLWISEGDETASQMLISAGAPTINSINVYPDLNRWKLLDPESRYSDIYNRYAHIQIQLQDEEETSFKLKSPDSFLIKLNIDDLKTLNITNIYTKKSLENLSNNNVQFNLITSGDEWNVYSVTYS